MASLRKQDNVLFLEGVLDFYTVVPLLPQLQKEVKEATAPVVDLEKVSYSNSAGVALLLEVLRNTSHGNTSFRHIPTDMMRVIRMCGLQDIIRQE